MNQNSSKFVIKVIIIACDEVCSVLHDLILTWHNIVAIQTLHMISFHHDIEGGAREMKMIQFPNPTCF